MSELNDPVKNWEDLYEYIKGLSISLFGQENIGIDTFGANHGHDLSIKYNYA
jgi:hypothetical protein